MWSSSISQSSSVRSTQPLLKLWCQCMRFRKGPARHGKSSDVGSSRSSTELLPVCFSVSPIFSGLFGKFLVSKLQRVSAGARDFLARLLVESENRLSAVEALEHPWLNASRLHWIFMTIWHRHHAVIQDSFRPEQSWTIYILLVVYQCIIVYPSN